MLVAIFGAFVTFVLAVFTDFLGGKSGKDAGKKKAKKPKAKKVETGTVDANGDEWLEGTYAMTTRSASKKAKKK